MNIKRCHGDCLLYEKSINFIFQKKEQIKVLKFLRQKDLRQVWLYQKVFFLLTPHEIFNNIRKHFEAPQTYILISHQIKFT
jgi:hypothetical protein